MKERILSIDCGTQSIRGIIFDEKGQIIECEKITFEPYFSKKPGWAEQNPEVYWNALCEASKKLKAKNNEEFKNIKAVVLSTLRDTLINVDEEGNVLRPTMTWLDQRMAKKPGKLTKFEKLIFSCVGMKKTIRIISEESKALWIKENQPEIWEKTFKYLQVSGYLNYKLTNKFVDSIASQIGHLPFDYKRKEWIKKDSNFKWRMFGVEREKLPDLVEAGTFIGNISEYASKKTGLSQDVKVIAGGSDKGCETLANGCIDVKSVSLSFGTTATIQTTSKKYIEPIKFMPPYPAVISERYNPEVEIFRGYWMIKWFKKEFANKEMQEAAQMNVSAEKLLNDRLNEIPPGSEGLILQPYWGPHVKTPNAKGAIIGFGASHTRIHIYRAIIEGINFGLIEGLKDIEKKSKKKVEKIMVAGGGAQSDTICQITSDMFNLPVHRIHTYEASALGAAIIGFVSLKKYTCYDEAVKNMVHYEKKFVPNQKNAEVYNKLYEKVYKKIYPNLKGLYNNLKHIV